jgi:hypothetical protein
MMDNIQLQATKGQVWATRFGYLVAFFAVLCCLVSMIPIWALFSHNSMAILQTSWYLRSKGELTTGTITDLEEVPGVKPYSGASYRLIVEFNVDGKTYTVKSYSPYHGEDYNRGDPVQVIYDPNNPETAQVDIFSERWFFPLLNSLPF